LDREAQSWCEQSREMRNYTSVCSSNSISSSVNDEDLIKKQIKLQIGQEISKASDLRAHQRNGRVEVLNSQKNASLISIQTKS
jgi:hypothetical protein